MGSGGPTREESGQPLLMPTCSAGSWLSFLSFRFFKHPLNGCMVMLSLQEEPELLLGNKTENR